MNEGNFFNTISLDGEELKEAKKRSNKQSDIILQFFTIYKGQLFTPAEVHHYLLANSLIPDNTPITSIRRAITCLTADGELIKTNTVKKGPMGMVNYCWRLATATDKQYTLVLE